MRVGKRLMKISQKYTKNKNLLFFLKAAKNKKY